MSDGLTLHRWWDLLKLELLEHMQLKKESKAEVQEEARKRFEEREACADPAGYRPGL